MYGEINTSLIIDFSETTLWLPSLESCPYKQARGVFKVHNRVMALGVRKGSDTVTNKNTPEKEWLKKTQQ